MTTPSIADLLKYADLQMAAEAFLSNNEITGAPVGDIEGALIVGNKHNSKFTPIQADNFLKYWKVETQQVNTSTGFSATLFKCIADDPATGAKAGELVISIRSTEFIDDAARDNQATNIAEISDTGFAWGQMRDMEAWYQRLLSEGKLSPGNFSLTGYSLGGHLATAFNLLHPGAAKQVVTFNGAGIGGHDKDVQLTTLLSDFTRLSQGNADGSSAFAFDDQPMNDLYGRVRQATPRKRVQGACCAA